MSGLEPRARRAEEDPWAAFWVGDQVAVTGGKYAGRRGNVFYVQTDGLVLVTGITSTVREAVVGVPAISPEHLIRTGRAPFQVGEQVDVTGGRYLGGSGPVSAVQSDGSVQIAGLGGLWSVLVGDPVVRPELLHRKTSQDCGDCQGDTCLTCNDIPGSSEVHDALTQLGDLAHLIPAATAALQLVAAAIRHGGADQADVVEAVKDSGLADAFAGIFDAASDAVLDEHIAAGFDPNDFDVRLEADNLTAVGSDIRRAISPHI
ncbi:hypothetical protein [Kitasatospora sp. NPDC002965]|uniref:hypothetical protein n=1 Tax=Kitasatospora sp. NPDC002965 TaxID=3154775 RepID=UPI0033AA8440